MERAKVQHEDKANHPDPPQEDLLPLRNQTADAPEDYGTQEEFQPSKPPFARGRPLLCRHSFRTQEGVGIEPWPSQQVSRMTPPGKSICWRPPPGQPFATDEDHKGQHPHE